MKRVFADTAYFVAGVEIVSVRHEHFQQGCDLYAEQAGFVRLMDPGPQGVREPAARYGARIDQAVDWNAIGDVGSEPRSAAQRQSPSSA